MKYLKKVTSLWLAVSMAMIALVQCNDTEKGCPKPRILISSDIGGTDPDDFQSMIHLLMYADLFQIEGLVSSPYGLGRKKDLLDMINLYGKDFSKLTEHATGFPDPDSLRSICKQGAFFTAPFKGFDTSTEGSDWIIKCSKRVSNQPLWVLVWGGLEDLAQALHDAPGIKEKIKVYWIGGPNKKWSVNAYSYIAANHPDLWMIEANATYRGWFMDSESPDNITNEAFFDNYIQERGAMGKAFKTYYKGILKMGDSPSLTYVMNGIPEDPFSESWGGNFSQIDRGSRVVFDRNTTISDTVVSYGVIEWVFKGPELDIHPDTACFALEISNQSWPGYYLGDGNYSVRYSSKKPEICTYITASSIPELNGHAGQFVSIAPWPGKAAQDDYQLGVSWFSDRPEQEFFFGVQQGARTVAKYREAFLSDWALRWEWLK
ncbi:MAG: nucleoside hydrolase-like domain-containing protein [Bacteroidota bacterium]